MIVDSHVHTGLTKYVPVEVLVAQMDAAGIDKAVLVQYMGQYDNRYQQEACQRYPGRFAPWGLVDTTLSDATEKIRVAVFQHQMVGFRVPVTARSPEANPYALWETLQELGVAVSLTGTRDAFAAPETAELVRRHPGLKMRIEHLGHPRFDEMDPFPQYRQVLQLARFSNVAIAYSGLYAASRQKYPYPDLLPFLKMIYDAFGPRRILWGSDFPPLCLRETVSMNLRLFQDGLGFLTPQDREWVLGKAALEFTRFL
ncbi:MAG: amidohydrolase [Planctomycetes bacterium]|nr:amidohydrolase [Planctomycetota bacterium]